MTLLNMFDDYIQENIYTTSASLLLGFTQCQKVCFLNVQKSNGSSERQLRGKHQNLNCGEPVKRGLARTVSLHSLFFLSVKNQGQKE